MEKKEIIKREDLDAADALREFNELVGYKRAIIDFRKILSVADLEVTKRIINHKMYKKMGYTLEEFYKQRLGLSVRTVKVYLKFEEEFGKDIYEDAANNNLSVHAMEAILRKKESIEAIKSAEARERIKALEAEVEKAQKEKEENRVKYDTAKRLEKNINQKDKRIEELERENNNLKWQMSPDSEGEKEFLEAISKRKIEADAIFWFIDRHISTMKKGFKKHMSYPLKACIALKTFCRYLDDFSHQYSLSIDNFIEGDIEINPEAVRQQAEKIKREWDEDYLQDIDEHRITFEELGKFEQEEEELKQKSEQGEDNE